MQKFKYQPGPLEVNETYLSLQLRDTTPNSKSMHTIGAPQGH